MNHNIILKLFVSTIMLVISTSSYGFENSNRDTIKVPIRAYYLFNQELGKLSVERDQKSLQPLLLAVNQIWRQAGIEFYFQEQGFYQPKDLKRYAYYMEKDRERRAVGTVCPKTKSGLKGIDFCVVGQRESNNGVFVSNFSVRSKINGRYKLPPLGRKDSRAPRVVIPVKSGSTVNPNVFAVARGLGVALRLKQRKGRTEEPLLMSKISKEIFFGNSYTSVILTREEIELARKNAQKIAS